MPTATLTRALPHWFRNLLPARAAVSHAERIRSGIGALLGILLTGLVSFQLIGSPSVALWLIAPMGASAVLLFGVPASPLAQPWSILGGNVVAALIGVACARWLPGPVPAASMAILLAIIAMFALRCLHPPSGAVALTAVLGGPEIHAAGFGFALAPVGLNSLLLLVVAVIYNKASGRRYPHTQQIEQAASHGTSDAAPERRLGFTGDDLQAVLAEFDQVLDVSPDDLGELLRRTEARAFRRRFGETLCRDFMSRDVVAVEFGTELSEAWDQMQAHAVHALPVVNRARHVVGIVTRTDFLRHAAPPDHGSLGASLRAFLRRTAHTHSDKHEVVGQIMSGHPTTTTDATPLADLVSQMSDAGFHHLPVVDAEKRLVGMVTQSDLIAALFAVGLAGRDGRVE